MDWRQVYAIGTDPETWFEDGDVVRWMADILPDAMSVKPISMDELWAWRQEEEMIFAHLDATASEALVREQYEKTLLSSVAPLALVLGCWLQGMSAPGVFEDKWYLDSLSLLADDLGTGRSYGARTDAFRLILKRVNHPLSYTTATSLAYETTIDDSMFALPAVLLAISRRSDTFHIAASAFDLVFRGIGRLPCFTSLNSHYPESIDWNRLDLATAGDISIVANPLALSMSLGERCRGKDGIQSSKFNEFTRWIFLALQNWSRDIRLRCAAVTNSSHAMAELLRNHSRAASVYHREKVIKGCPLSEHLQQAATDPVPVMDMLSNSPYIRRGNSVRSPLVNSLVSPQGPMFRVFSQSELQTISKWIDSLEHTSETQVNSITHPHLTLPTKPSSIRHAQSGDLPPRDLRSAYYLLQGRALAPATRTFAVHYVHSWLRAAKRTKICPDRSLQTSWLPGTLQDWLLRQHDLHGEKFEAGKRAQTVAIPSREDVIESTLQLAPLVLIDGSWLQGFTDLTLATSEVGIPLFQIYWDELGNGHKELNHPVIYRKLLQSMDVHLAPTASWEFAMDRRLRNDSFRLPVLWLCLGKLPRTFLPEVLGMNLAMELSGVGDGYRDARGFLTYYGFSTQFVDLHNTIDNVVNGHSAWAAMAIENYMESIANSGNSVTEIWQRVRTGYAALTTRPREFISPLKFLLNNARKIQHTSSPSHLQPLHHPTLSTN